MSLSRLIPLIIRALIPVCILGISGYAYWVLSVEPEEAKGKKAPAQKIRTKVTQLRVADYSVRVKTNGIVQPHNQVTLSAEVAGRAVAVHPAMEVGAYFSAGEILVEIDDRDYQTALAVIQAQHKIALAAHELAVNTRERLQELYSKNAVNQAELEGAEAALTQRVGELDRAVAQIEQAERDLERTKIRAPFDGRVHQKLVGLGQRLAAGTALGEVFAVDYAEVRLPLARRDLRFLNLPELPSDEPVPVVLSDAIDETNVNRWTALIVRTEGKLDPNSLELFAVARIDDPFGLHHSQPRLRMGQPVVAMITGSELQDVILIPRSAVRQLDQVYLVDKNKLTLSSRTVQPLWADENFIVVQDPAIRSDDWLATTQLVYAPEGSPVEIIPAAEADAAEALASTEVDQP